LPFEERVIERASSYRYLADIRLHTCSAEDLVVLKAFADRPRDWADIEGILIRTGSRLDWHTIEAELQPLCEAKEAPHPPPAERPAHLVLRPNRGETMRTPRHRVGGNAELNGAAAVRRRGAGGSRPP
jgi:hypothetical protein